MALLQQQYNESSNLYISSPLVISITISDYNEDAINAEIDEKDVKICQSNQLFTHYDTENICNLCNEYKYYLVPTYERTHWTETDIMEFLQLCVQIRFDEKYSFDGVLIIISAHGDTENIITSDFKLIKKETIHRLFSTLDPKYRSLPRIVIFDAKTTGIGEYHLDFYRHPPKYSEYDGNPDVLDYRLAVIDIAHRPHHTTHNGSLLIRSFIEMVMENSNNQIVLYDIITNIQSLLANNFEINIVYKFYGYSANVIFTKQHDENLKSNTRYPHSKLKSVRKCCLRPFIVLKMVFFHYYHLI